MFVKGHIGTQAYTLAALYAPHRAQIQFLDDMLNKLEAFIEGTLILGGYLNLVLDPLIDTSKGEDNCHMRPYAALKNAYTSIN